MMHWLEKHVIPVAGRIGAQRHLVAIRDGFVSVIPLIIIGSFAILLNNFPLPSIEGYQGFMMGIFGENFTMFGGNIWDASYAILALLVTMSISYHLARSYGVDGLATAILSVSTFVMLSPFTEDWGLSLAWTGSQGLFVALFNAIIITELFRVLVNSRFTIKMPQGVPEGVTKSFRSLIPFLLILIGLSLFQMFMALVMNTSVHELVFQWIQTPLLSLSNSLPAALIVVFLNHFLWFFGLHGTNIMSPIMEGVYLTASVTNTELVQAGASIFGDELAIVTKAFFDAYVFMGGSGTTLALIAAIFIVAKTSHYRTVGKLGAPGAAFNINEPIMFGVPIVLNASLFIPFLLSPILLTIISYFAISLGFVAKTAVAIPWTTPPIISGFLVSGHWSGVILQLFNLALATLIYIPFIKISERAQEKIEKENT
ncbi:PTS sugar transporter subunit IIC [Alkalihalobacillus sp. LMS6]|uniref:PTS sugar transporter subunit IIC n=1 Tax=Alkalihalobacillus sp. LMS6 TaxID=2924034 RepID=UPI0020D16188|nr:PTS sugar transporter subunit IIC [Alkalihalobacillus sp. LMS6]UTR06966.1 PTS sugar transporter subunit IIC [Alkalihalobacillus sp. LMS6]